VWTLTKDADVKGNDDNPFEESPTRYLSAYGRDVELSPEALKFDMETRRLELTGLSRSAVGKDGRVRGVIGLIKDLIPRSKNEIAHAIGGDRNAAYAAIDSLIDDGRLVWYAKKGNGSTYIYMPDLGTDPRDLVEKNDQK
jgi:hypothetical protein